MPDQNQSDPSSSTVTSSPQAPVDSTVSTIPPVTSAADPATTSLPTQTVTPDVPAFFQADDVPSVPDFQTTAVETPSATPSPAVADTMVQQPVNPTDISSGSAAPITDTPTDTPMNVFTPTVSSPKKKFGGGKIIATILGLFILVGGVGAGIVLTQQQQVLTPKAGSNCSDHHSSSSCGGTCANGHQCKWKTSANNPDGTCDEVSASCTTTSTGGDVPNPADKCQAGQTMCQHDSTTHQNTGYNCTCNTVLDPNDWTCTTLDTQTCTPPGDVSGNINSCGTLATDTYQRVGACIKFNGSGQGTIYNYECDGAGDYSGGCSQNPTHQFVTNGQSVCLPSKPAGWCGALQMDGGGGNNCIVSNVNTTNCSTATTPPGGTPPGATAKCENIKAYSDSYALLTAAQLSSLAVGTHINFCVVGSASAGTFDKARFTINGVAQTETTTHRPTTQDYCQAYTIPAATTVFNVTAQMHHITLGWE